MFSLPNFSNTLNDFALKYGKAFVHHPQQPVKKYFLWYFKILYILE